jgi:hypothetical protein
MRQEFLEPPKPEKQRGPLRLIRPTLKEINALIGKLKRKERELENFRGKAMLLKAHPEAIEREIKERKEIIAREFEEIRKYLEGLTDPGRAVRCSLPKKKQRELGIIA